MNEVYGKIRDQLPIKADSSCSFPLSLWFLMKPANSGRKIIQNNRLFSSLRSFRSPSYFVSASLNAILNNFSLDVV